MAQAANLTGDTETTQEAMSAIQGLEVSVDQLGLQRSGSGGGIVSGLVINKTLEEGATVTLEFTFYGTADNELGSLSPRRFLPERSIRPNRSKSSSTPPRP